MKIIIAQLSDVHFKKDGNPLFEKLEPLTNAISSKANSTNSDRVLLLNNGDLANWGLAEEFVVGEQFMNDLSASLKDFSPQWYVEPGNHDCNFSRSQKIRDKLLEDISTEKPETEILENILSPLKEYFEMVDRNPEWSSIDEQFPLVRQLIVEENAKPVLAINLINSAWMSQKNEQPGSLCFPLGTLSELKNRDCFTISMLHHPINWFEQPNTMRQLAGNIEAVSDLILTGHEHSQQMITKTYDTNEVGRTSYFEAGVLQELDVPNLCTFNLFVLDTDTSQLDALKFSWNENGFFDESELSNITAYPLRRFRQQTRRSLKSHFLGFLNEIELPFTSSRKGLLSLDDLFVLPDLRERKAKSSNWRRIKSRNVLEEIIKAEKVLITGPEMCGKSCLSKVLFKRLHTDEKIPLLLDATIVGKVSMDAHLNKILKQVVKKQYDSMDHAEFQQLEKSNRVVIVDNLNRCDLTLRQIDEFLNFLERVFGTVIVIGGDEFWLYEVNPGLDFDGFRKMEVCEFGHLKIEELAAKWHGLDEDVSDFDAKVKKATKLLETVLSSEVIPQYPWIIVALLQESETSEEIAAKNGSFGHLYQSLMVAALARSTSSQLDVPGKITYLAELAMYLYQKNQVFVDQTEIEQFHKNHCTKYGINLAKNETLAEFVDSGVLSKRNGELFFKAKFSFCFFVAWYFSKNIHKTAVRKRLKEITHALSHIETANILVFLAHLSNDPIIVNEILSSAESLFESADPATFTDDVQGIKLLTLADIHVKLPESNPEDNRKAIADDKDEAKLTKSDKEADGRHLSPRPSEESRDQKHKEIVASIKAIQILGQILRNGMASLEGGIKKKITRSVFLLARRMLGQMFDEVEGLETHVLAFIEDHIDEIDQDEDMQQAIDHYFDLLFWIGYGVGAGISTKVAQSVGMGLLEQTFKEVLSGDPCIPNRVFDLAIRLEHSKHVPSKLIISIFEEFKSNQYVKSIIKMLVSRQMVIRNVPYDQDQLICQKLGLERSAKKKSHLDPSKKLIGRS